MDNRHRRWLFRSATSAALVLAAVGPLPSVAHVASVPVRPTVAEYTQLTTSATPPTEAQCASVGRRCFTPQSIRAAYNLQPLYDAGLDGRGQTIAVVDSYGSDTIAHDPARVQHGVRAATDVR